MASNHPGSAGLAQSGGRNTTFGGGTGGTPLSRNVTKGQRTGTGTQNGVNQYIIRQAGGDSTPVASRGKVGPPPPLHAGDAGQSTAIVKPHQRPPAYKGSQDASGGGRSRGSI